MQMTPLKLVAVSEYSYLFLLNCRWSSNRCLNIKRMIKELYKIQVTYWDNIQGKIK